MKKFFSLLIISFSVVFSISAYNTAEKERFLSELKSGIAEVSAVLPMSPQQGMWFWSASMENNTIKYVYKYSDAVRKQFGSEASEKAVYENMANNLPYTILEEFSDDEKLIFAENITFKYEIYSFDTNKLLFSKTIKPAELKKMLQKSNFEGNRPLSYYKNGFESEKVNLPQKANDYLILNDVNMNGSKVIFDFFVDENMVDDDVYYRIKNSFLQKYKSTSTLEMKQDYITYNIKFYYRFYSLNNKKKLVKELIIDPAKDF